ncbi:MAG: hypothetical protein J6A05_07420, partial [Oscillospiraceae bacterium]|nr:hypothetical protein [Oscillospiraceae bacterium]
MDKNKKKALIKSVAAFTFAMSMFAAQSPTASAMEAETLSDGAVLTAAHTEEDDDDNQNSSQLEEAGDDVGDIVTSQDVIPVVNDALTNSNGKIIGDTYVESEFYNPDAELGIANNFHIFTNGTVENNAHINGN